MVYCIFVAEAESEAEEREHKKAGQVQLNPYIS